VRLVVIGVVFCLSAVAPVGAQSKTPLAILRSDASREAKVEACRRLAVTGDASAVPVLAGLLCDPEMSHMARYALEPIPGPAADKALRDALAAAGGDVLVGVMSSIAVRRDARAVPVLVPFLQSESVDVVAAAADALARIGTADAAAAIGELRGSAGVRLKVVAADASLVLADSLRARGNVPGAVAVYALLESGDWPEHVSLAAFSALLRTGSAKSAPLLIGAIEGDDPVRRAIAINRLPRVKDAAVVADVLSRMHAMPAEGQVQLIDILAKAKPAGITVALQKAAESSHAEVRAAAVKGLAVSGGADVVVLMCKMVQSGKSAEERAAAAEGLLSLKGDGVDAAIVKCMTAAPSAGKVALIKVLAGREAASAASALLARAGQGDADVRKAALRALGTLAGAESMDGLLRVLATAGDDGLRKEAERAVVSVARGGSPVAAQVDKVLAGLNDTSATPVYCSLLRVLGGIGDARGLQAVQDAAGHAEANPRDAAVRVLADWPDAAALDPVLELMRTVKDPKHRVLLLRGSVRLLGIDARAPHLKTAAYAKLLAGLEGADRKRLVLAGLARTGDASAIEVVEPLLDDKAVRSEAELAAMAIAGRACNEAPQAVKRLVTRLRRAGSTPAIKKRAAALLASIEKLGGYVTAWRASGPYEAGDRLPPLTGGKEKAKWVPVPVTLNGARPFMLSLAAAVGGGDNRLGFVRTSIHCARGTSARFEFGTDDANEVWLNGRSVFRTDQDGAAIPGEHKVDVELKEGWNFLMLKVTQVSGPWEYCLRAVGRDGKPLEGVRYLAGREPAAEQWPLVEQKVAAKTPPLAPPPIPKGPWQPLFDGKSLDGWEITGDAIFKVEDGCLVGTQTTGKGGNIWHKQQRDDFELRVEYRVDWPANSGFWFRCTKRGRGYQYDVLKHPRPVAFSGSLYCPGKLFLTRNLKEQLENRDDWNEALISANGDELAVWLNGNLVGHCREGSFKEGHIGLQVHGGDHFKGMRIVVRKLEVRDLD